MTTTPTRQDVLIAGVAVIVLLPLTATISFVSLPASSAWIVVVLAAVGHAALLWRRAHPLTALVVVAAVVGGAVVVTGLFFLLPSSLVFLIVLHSATAYGSPRWLPIAIGLIGSAAAVGRYAADTSVVDAGFGPPPWLLFLLFAAVVLCSWTMGLLRRAQLLAMRLAEDRAESERRDRTQREALAALEERARISRDLHDVLAHSLSVIVGQARVARFHETRATEAIAVIEDTARDSLHEIRTLLRGIRDDETTDDSRSRRRPTLAELPELVEQARSLGCTVTHSTEGTPMPIGPEAQFAIYRFVQEAFTNVAKHAHPGAAVHLVMQWGSDRLTVTIANDRVRARAPSGLAEAGLGLQGMGERLHAVGGTVTAGATADGGFLVTAAVPIRTERTR